MTGAWEEVLSILNWAPVLLSSIRAMLRILSEVQVVSIATISITWVSMTASVMGQNLYFNVAETSLVGLHHRAFNQCHEILNAISNICELLSPLTCFGNHVAHASAFMGLASVCGDQWCAFMRCLCACSLSGMHVHGPQSVSPSPSLHHCSYTPSGRVSYLQPNSEAVEGTTDSTFLV